MHFDTYFLAHKGLLYVYVTKYFIVMLSGDRLPRKKQMEKCEKCCPPNAGQIKQRSSGQTAQKDI
jgi:hypothetical protein